jgi:ectoine hydroxylase-related dioxygenase (phytanoyl-CoA dioxygenase family)
MRFTSEHVERWRSEGFAVIEKFFDPSEHEPVLADFERLHGPASPGAGTAGHSDGAADTRSTRALQFKNIAILPFEASSAINLIALHPQLIAFARALLGTDDVRLYQCHSWAKYTGETDYDQDFHCDYGNHTLTVPADAAELRTVDFVLYFTDVTREHGALRYVTKPDVLAALGRPAISGFNEREQQTLREREQAVVVPAGSLLAHGIDTVHRGSNLTAPGGRRFSLTVGYKAAGNDQVGFHVWQDRGGKRPWHLIFNHATPDQLACLGIPRPGDAFWSRRTLRLTQTRWPDWDMRAYFDALAERRDERG